jgi:uncharacterized protein (DUF1501 family)
MVVGFAVGGPAMPIIREKARMQWVQNQPAYKEAAAAVEQATASLEQALAHVLDDPGEYYRAVEKAQLVLDEAEDKLAATEAQLSHQFQASLKLVTN